MTLMAYWTGKLQRQFLIVLVGQRTKASRQCDIPSFGCRWPRMRFWSLDLVASEWNGPQALTRSHPVPTCINSCGPGTRFRAVIRGVSPPALRQAGSLCSFNAWRPLRRYALNDIDTAYFWLLAMLQVVHGATRESRPVRLIAAPTCVGCRLTRPVDLPHKVFV